MESVISRKDLKSKAKEALKDKWGQAALASLIFCLIGIVPGAFAGVGTVIFLIIEGPMVLGYTIYLFGIRKGETPKLETVFDGFKRFAPAMTLFILITIFTILWALLLIIPGIIAVIRYSMAFFILSENPEISAIDALNKSKEITAGHKAEIFVLGLSFILWMLLIVVTLGIAFFWVYPYMYMTLINYYNNLKSANPPASEKD